MATIEHWEVTDEKEMWQKLVGHDAEDTLETRQQANVFSMVSLAVLVWKLEPVSAVCCSWPAIDSQVPSGLITRAAWCSDHPFICTMY